jgi:Ni/Co efflux regulator RcnB
MHRFLVSALLLSAVLITPMALRAEDKRYYDREGKDYHTWNNHEDRAYRVYLGEQHREYREFPRVKATQQREYYRWRHEHPDTHPIFKVEVR